MWKSFAWKNPDPSISAKAYFNMYSVQICRRKATYLDEDSAKDVSSAEIFIRKCEPAIRKKGKRTAHSWGVILVIFKDGSVLSYSRGKKLLDMYFLKMSYLIEGSRKNREKIDYSLMEASNFPGQTLQYNQYEKPKIKKRHAWMRENELTTPFMPKAKEKLGMLYLKLRGTQQDFGPWGRPLSFSRSGRFSWTLMLSKL